MLSRCVYNSFPAAASHNQWSSVEPNRAEFQVEPEARPELPTLCWTNGSPQEQSGRCDAFFHSRNGAASWLADVVVLR